MLAERLKILRKQNQLTQLQFANIFKISGGTIAMWETGKREPDNEMLSKIADYFDVSIDYLLGRADEPKPTSEDNLEIPEELKEVRLAFYGGPSGLSQKSLEDIADFVKFVKERDSKKSN